MTDLDGRCFVRKGNSLIPADFAADEFLSEIKDGAEIIVTIRKPRSPKHHRFFFAMLRKVLENTDDWQTEDELLDALKLATGHTEQRLTLEGKMYTVPRSISFASMPEDVFTRFRKRCCYILAKTLGIDPETLMAETEEMQR